MEQGLNYELTVVNDFQVVVVGVEGLKSVSANRIIYCTIEVEGEGKLQSEHMEASKAV